MVRFAHRTWSSFVAIGVCASSGRAQTGHAEPPRIENIRVEYAAPAGCPGFDTFFGWVRERAPSAHLAAENEDVRLFSVSFEVRSGETIGRVAVHEPAKTTETREVTAATCQETAAALALIVAVAVDPSSMSRPTESELSPKPESEPRESHAEPAPSTVEPPQPTAQMGLSDAGAYPEAATPLRPWRWLVAVSAEATGGPAPGFTPALRLVAAARLFSDVAPTVRLSAARSVDRTVQADDGREAELTWTAARLEGCVAFPFGALELEPCAGVEGGVLHGEGTTEVIEPKRESRPWWAALAGGRLRLLAAEYLTFELGAGALVPLQRDEFVLHPNTPVHQPPPVAAFSGLGAGVRFK